MNLANICSSPSRAAFAYVAITCLLYALIPSLTFPNPPLDVVEGFAWGRELQLGYTKHPPMQAWLLEGSYWISGGRLSGAYWLSAFCLAFGYLFMWRLARRLGLGEWQAFWSVVLTSVTFYFTLPVPEFNPNILQIPIWTGMILLFHRALADDRLIDWLLLGLLAAFGLYTKYFVALLIGVIGLYALAFADGRRTLARPGPWLCALVCLACFGPHLIWLVQTDFVTFEYAAQRSKPPAGLADHAYNPLNFLFAQLANHGGLLLVALAGLGLAGLRQVTGISSRGAQAPVRRDRSFLLWFALTPLLLVLLASAITGNEFKHMWGTPLFTLSGMMVVTLLDLPTAMRFPRRAIIAAVAIQAIFLSVLLGQAILEPLWKTKMTRIHFPGNEISAAMTGIWKQETGTELAYVAGDMWPSANIVINAPLRPSMYYLGDPKLSPWIDADAVQAHGMLVVWLGDRDQPPGDLLARYPGLRRDGYRDFRSAAGGTLPPVRVNWRILGPGLVPEPVLGE